MLRQISTDFISGLKKERLTRKIAEYSKSMRNETEVQTTKTETNVEKADFKLKLLEVCP